MRICPKCGYHDSPLWRPRGNRPYCEYSKVENVGYSQPELIEKIREAEPYPYYDGHFVYHISKTGKNVERIELELFKKIKWGQEPTERRGDEPSTFNPWKKVTELAIGQTSLILTQSENCTKGELKDAR